MLILKLQTSHFSSVLILKNGAIGIVMVGRSVSRIHVHVRVFVALGFNSETCRRPFKRVKRTPDCLLGSTPIQALQTLPAP